jgi:tubulin polyglutamylase TTLL6/13
VYIYPNAKRLVWQQRLLSKVLSAARNGRDTFYCTNRFWGMREACQKSNTERWVRLFESFCDPPARVARPETYLFPEEVGQFNRESKQYASRSYILKPDDQSCGRGISLALDRSEAIRLGFQSNAVGKRGEDVVVQEYVDNPLLFRGRKIDLRLYVVITGVRNNQLQYAYEREWCFARIAGAKYAKPTRLNAGNLRVHLSNTTLAEDKEAAKQSAEAVLETIAEEQLKGRYGVDLEGWEEGGWRRGGASKFGPGDEDPPRWTCPSCKNKNSYLWAATEQCKRCRRPNPACFGENAFDVEAMWEKVEDVLYPTLHAIAPGVALHYQNLFPLDEGGGADHCFQVLGFDVLVTQDRAWLIEVNPNASFALETPLDKAIKLDVVREAFRSKTVPKYRCTSAFDAVSPSFKFAQRFVNNCYALYSIFTSQALKKPSSELRPMGRGISRRMRRRIAEEFAGRLPKACIDALGEDIFPDPVLFYTFLEGMKKCRQHLERDGKGRTEAMALLGQILAALTQLNDEIAIGENGCGLSLSQSLSSSLTVQKPKALEVTKLGWPLRKDMDRKPSPRVKSVKGLSNLERHKGGEGAGGSSSSSGRKKGGGGTR